MAIPTYEEYKATNPAATWIEYVSRYSAMAAEKQVAAGEIPSEYGAGYSFTSAGVWVPSGSPAAIGGLPSEIKTIFPGVEEYYQTAYKQATEGSVITTSRVSEAQVSFNPLPTLTPELGTISSGGGQASIQFNDVGGVPQTGVGAPIGTIGQTYFSGGNGGNGNGNGEGGLGILALIALFLGMGGL